ncbi:MAG: rhomboid family intramembrane serine protease [Flavobacteriaceae bacterium]|nr:rhomboid family intramembrane serine protease [Flavobacteriaceae bacterium]
MSSTIDQIKKKFHTATVVEQIIYINIVIFILTYLFKAISTLMQWNGNFLSNWFSLPADITTFFNKPWTIISYGFLHADFLHILFNSIILYYFGNLFLNFFSNKQFYLYFFLGIFTGGLLFILSYNYFPALKNDISYLVGASAGVTAIVIGLAAKIPNYAMHFRFIGSIKLWYIAVAFVLLDVIQIPTNNTGGHLAHLGGALIGFLLTTQLNEGKSLSNLFPKVSFSRKQKPLKTVYKKSKPNTASLDKNVQQKRIDGILDKISKSGYETLSQEEKDFLFSVGKKK